MAHGGRCHRHRRRHGGEPPEGFRGDAEFSIVTREDADVRLPRGRVGLLPRPITVAEVHAERRRRRDTCFAGGNSRRWSVRGECVRVWRRAL